MSANPTRVLIVEDNPGDVRLLNYAFQERQWPAELSHAADGERALTHFVDGAVLPDLVILDLNLPKYHGAHVLRKIRGNRVADQVTVVILSSAPYDLMIEQLHREGVDADGYFSKASDYDEFLSVVSRIRECFERNHAVRQAHGGG
jgi:DNA-binding response OmpR family regulator